MGHHILFMTIKKRKPKKVEVIDVLDDLELVEIDEDTPVKKTRTRRRKKPVVDREKGMKVVKQGLDAGYQVADLVFSIISLFN